MNYNHLFINKFKPIYFEDFEQDNNTINILTSYILLDNINILLVGNYACGKTTILNAVIREYYKGYTPKEYEENILYINNLQEQGINYYRTDVKNFCQTCSVIKNKKKFVFLDDIDTINEQSQQVFRNCIDKYSHNVNFISSCNNIQKVIESIQSRLTMIRIQPFTDENISKIIQNIKKTENIDIEKEAEDYIINISNKTVNTVINYMEKFKILNQKITLPIAIQLSSNISFLIYEEYTKHILKNDLHNSIKIIFSIYEKGFSLIDILDNYFVFIKSTNILNENQKYHTIQCVCKYITIFYTHDDEIELTLFTNNLIQLLNII